MPTSFRSALALTLLAAAAALAQAATPRRPAAVPATGPEPIKEFPPLPHDPIERPDFLNKPHPITKSVSSINALVVRISDDGTMIGRTADVIASVPPDSRKAGPGSAGIVTNQAQVGDEMKTSFVEALKAVHMRYPNWAPGHIDISFSDKYTPHDGGSAGTAFATLMLSELEGFDIDSKAAITGDISVDWKVLKIGGVAAKIRGATADKCLYVCIPEDNEGSLDDMALLYTNNCLIDIQIFTIETLQDAMSLMRTDRNQQITDAMKLFSSLQPKIRTLTGLRNPDNIRTLQQILAMTPNHASAKHLLAIAQNTNPKTLSIGAAMSELTPAVYSVEDFLFEGKTPNRAALSAGAVTGAQKIINQVRPISPKEIQPLIVDLSAFISTADGVASGRLKPDSLDPKREAFFDRLDALKYDKDFAAKMMRDGGF